MFFIDKSHKMVPADLLQLYGRYGYYSFNRSVYYFHVKDLF